MFQTLLHQLSEPSYLIYKHAPLFFPIFLSVLMPLQKLLCFMEYYSQLALVIDFLFSDFITTSSPLATTLLFVCFRRSPSLTGEAWPLFNCFSINCSLVCQSNDLNVSLFLFSWICFLKSRNFALGLILRSFKLLPLSRSDTIWSAAASSLSLSSFLKPIRFESSLCFRL